MASALSAKGSPVPGTGHWHYRKGATNDPAAHDPLFSMRYADPRRYDLKGARRAAERKVSRDPSRWEAA